MQETINMKRSDIGPCRGCGADSDGVVFKGVFNPYGTQLESDCGWWLSLNHHSNWVTKARYPDFVSELLCPPCLKGRNERMSEFIFGEM